MNILRIITLCLVTAALVMGAAMPAAAQTVAVMVNGDPITNMDIDQRMKLTTISTRTKPTRQQVIEDLIEEKLKIKEGKKYGVDPTSSDIDGSYASMSSRLRMTPDQLSKSLESQGIRPDTLRSRMKAEMVWGSLVRGRYKDSLQVGERDVQNALGEGDKDSEGFEYQMRPIVLLVTRGSAAGVVEARKKEAEALRSRVKSCEEAEALFTAMQSATIRATVVKTSADLPEPLRAVLDKTPVGSLTEPEVTRNGVEMVALCARRTTKVDTPKKREIRDKMFAEKYEARSKSYLRDIRKAAMIEYR